MNRKKTILIAVLINAGLLAVLFIAALCTQEDATVAEPISVAEPLPLPPFEDKPLFNEPQIAAVIEPEPVIHALPPLSQNPLCLRRPCLYPCLHPSPRPCPYLPLSAKSR